MTDVKFPRPSTLAQAPASTSLSNKWKKMFLSHTFDNLDRVKVLGDEQSGHTGCVNALSWAQDGEILISGGDDTTIRLWRMDPGNITIDYPFMCQSVIHTGHRGNIFNAQMLPFSSRIATVAGDKQVRVFDVAGHSPVGQETIHSTSESAIRVLRCHSGRVKRIIVEDSPDLFLTVAEDGTVRQHDLRTPHTCNSGTCPTPLVKLPHDLSTIALSPLTPYQFVVGGESPYGYLFDRRQAGRILQEEWGVPPTLDDITTCVRRFGRRSRAPGERRGYEHITGARMASSNGHEILLSYSSDAVFLFSTLDNAEIAGTDRPSVLSPNEEAESTNQPTAITTAESKAADRLYQDVEIVDDDTDHSIWSEAEQTMDNESETVEGIDEDDEDDKDDGNEGESSNSDHHSTVPVVFPRSRFAGHCNVETVKDVNFLGPNDEYIASGSDDGNVFIWRKATGVVHEILEGDSSVVNVIEPHPHLPIIAVSGIDTTVKLFAPGHNGPSKFSRMSNLATITDRNALAARHTAARRMDPAQILLRYQRLLRIIGENGEEDGIGTEQCTHQ